MIQKKEKEMKTKEESVSLERGDERRKRKMEKEIEILEKNE